MIQNCGHLIEPLLELAEEAGDCLLKYFSRSDTFTVTQKSNHTPVTDADFAAHQIIIEGLKALTRQVPILSEEGSLPAFEERKSWSEYWLLDPLDGTRGFIENVPEFTVNIALIKNNQPILGLIYVPVEKIFYYAFKDGGAFKKIVGLREEKLHAIHSEVKKIRILVGRFHNINRLEPIIKHWMRTEIITLNSSYKFGRLAEGGADIYLRYGPTQEWDTAAGQCILEEIGGVVVDLSGQKLEYNRKISLENPPFIALRDAKQLNLILSLLNSD